MKNPQNIVITGASSGIGAALARHYAKPGVTLHLQGRNQERLQQVVQDCQKQGAAIKATVLDVTDAAGMSNWLIATDKTKPVDLIIANAGISAGTGTQGETAEQVKQIFATNIDGVLNSVHPLLPMMLERRRGQVAIVSSIAGMRGLPSSPAYSASKACVRTYGEGLRGWLSSHGVEVSVVCPGYIRTPMTAVNNYPMPLIMDAGKAAKIIAKGLARNQSRIAFPLGLYLPLWFLTCLSPTITDAFFSRLPAKPSVADIKAAKEAA